MDYLKQENVFEHVYAIHSKEMSKNQTSTQTESNFWTDKRIDLNNITFITVMSLLSFISHNFRLKIAQRSCFLFGYLIWCFWILSATTLVTEFSLI